MFEASRRVAMQCVAVEAHIMMMAASMTPAPLRLMSFTLPCNRQTVSHLTVIISSYTYERMYAATAARIVNRPVSLVVSTQFVKRPVE